MDGQPGRTAQAARLLALLVTNCIKLGGLYLAIRAAVTEANPSVVQIGEACFMMAGAQVTEDAVLKLVTRMFGGGHEHHESPGGHEGGEGGR